MEKALEDVNKAECNALVVFLGNFGPETPETLIAERFDGPCMYVAAESSPETDKKMEDPGRTSFRSQSCKQDRRDFQCSA